MKSIEEATTIRHKILYAFEVFKTKVKSKTSTTDLLPQDAIFLNQIFNDLVLALVQPTSEGNDEK